MFDQERNRAAGEEILERRIALASLVTQLQFRRTPGLRESLGAAGWAKSIRDAESNLQFLSEAVASGDADSFGAYLVWLDGVLTGVGLERLVLDGHLDCMVETLSAELSPPARELASEYIRSGRDALASSRAKVSR